MNLEPEDRFVLGYTTATGPELQAFVAARQVPEEEIDRATEYLHTNDPAGLNGIITRDDVARVAVHLTGMVGPVAVRSPTWQALVKGHYAAPAIYFHEIREMYWLNWAGFPNPSSLGRGTPEWFRAHARACWEETEYWRMWGLAEGRYLSPEALLLANPVRGPEERTNLIRVLREVGVTIRAPSGSEFRRAEAFYRARGLTGRGW